MTAGSQPVELTTRSGGIRSKLVTAGSNPWVIFGFGVLTLAAGMLMGWGWLDANGAFCGPRCFGLSEISYRYRFILSTIGLASGAGVAAATLRLAWQSPAFSRRAVSAYWLSSLALWATMLQILFALTGLGLRAGP